jgi:hypothetical protein
MGRVRRAIDRLCPSLTFTRSAWSMKSKSIWKVRDACGIAEVESPRAVM